jgi:hypothetical protein
MYVIVFNCLFRPFRHSYYSFTLWQTSDFSSPLNHVKLIAKQAYCADLLLYIAFHEEAISSISEKQIEQLRISHAGPIRGQLEESDLRRKEVRPHVHALPLAILLSLSFFPLLLTILWFLTRAARSSTE